MNGRARRRAFLLGCNSGGLEHCECDAGRLEAVFTHLGYEVESCLASSYLEPCCAARRTPADEVRGRLGRFLNQSQPGEISLVYFSGHSLVQYETFNLVVGNDLSDRHHLLNVKALDEFFTKDPFHGDRVLILDCCHAAQAVTPDFWHAALNGVRRTRVWVATEADGYAVEQAGGSLFTRWIIEALTEAAPLLARAGWISINAVDLFVQERARAHRSPSGKPVPIPGVLGFTADDILLAEWTTDFPRAARDELHTLLCGCALAPAVWHPIYEDVRAAAGLSAAAGHRGSTAVNDLAAAVATLAAAWYRPFEGVVIRVPLAEFVERIAREVDAPSADKLRAWLRLHLQALAGEQDIDAFIGSLALGRTALAGVRPQPPSYLAIALCPRDANRPTQYSVEARLVDSQGCGNSEWAPPDLTPVGSMPNIMRDVLNQPAVLEAIRAPERPLMIEFFLCRELLGAEVDDWTPARPSADDPPLTGRHLVTVRALDRFGLCPCPDGAGDPEPYVANWSRHWAACAPCRAREQDGSRVPACCCWVAQPRRSYQTLARNGCLFVLGFRPDGEHLRPMLRDGLAAVLWCDEPPTEAFVKETLIAEVARSYPNSPKRPCLADLPQALLHLRQDAWEQDQGHTGHYHLLWDDPDRIPAFTGRPAPAPAAPAQPPTPRLQSPF